MGYAGSMRGVLCGIFLLLAALIARPAAAQPYAPYDGHNPFNCQLQKLGTGTEYPDPDADPFCVEFDKTQQNVSDFGIADFLANEPTRVAAASPKCFYFQHDHWTGSVVQGGEPEIWHWDGSYFFDKARGLGGVHVANFRIGGEPADATPYAPEEFQPYMTEGGGGGVQFAEGIEVEPRCAEQADSRLERRSVYYHRIGGGRIHRKRIAAAKLLTLRRMALRRLGPAHVRHAHTDRWDVEGGGQLRAAWRGTALDRRIAALLTTAPGHHRGLLRPGVRGKSARRAFPSKLGRMAGYKVIEAPQKRGSRMLAGVRRGRIAWIAVLDPRRIGAAALPRTLRHLLSGPPLRPAPGG
jgi:hypothetical protein